MSRFLGLDIGNKRIGVAISDESNMIARGMDVLTRENDDEVFKNIKEKIDKWQIESVIVGMPFMTNVNEIKKSQQGERINNFVEKLKLKLNIPVILQDERYTTKESKRVLSDAKLSLKRDKGLKDKISAQLILQTYLDKL